MPDLYRILFSASYWRRVASRSHWQEAGYSFRRTFKDKRARTSLLRLGFLLLVPLLCSAYLIWLVTSGGIFLAPFVITAFWWIRRSNKRSDPPSITPVVVANPLPLLEEDPSTRDYLARTGILHAVMLVRESSEAFLLEKQLPAGVEVIARRTHIDLLRELGIWDKMAGTAREALMIPDGHWGSDRIGQTIPALERLRLLRWVLRVDHFLPTLQIHTSLTYATALEIVEKPHLMLHARKLIDRHSVSVARQSAEHYFYRCAAESISRGLHSSDDAAVKGWAEEVQAALAGNQHEDLLIGASLVSETCSADVSRTLETARVRMNFLAWIEALLNGSAALAFPFAFPEEPEVE